MTYQQPDPQPAHSQPPAPVKAPKHKLTAPTWLIAISITLVALCCIGGGILAVVGIAGTDTDGDPLNDASPVTQPTEQGTPAPAGPNPDGTVEGACDLLLFVEGDQSEFAASIDVANVGNVGIVVEVTAAFDQLGQDDYTITDEVRVEVGATETVHLAERIDHAAVARHQDGGYECRVSGEIVDTFGDVQD
jgi:hypothetical protein